MSGRPQVEESGGAVEMDITVARYAPVAACDGFAADEIGEHQLPEGFPFLIDRRTGGIVEPAFRYIYERAVSRRRTSRRRQLTLESAVAAADNLRLWWGYTRYRGKSWDRITAIDIDAYRRGLGRVVSPRTGEPLAEGTKRQRIVQVLELYRWSNAEGLTAVDEKALGRDATPSTKGEAAAKIRVLTYEQWKRLRPLVGPLPSDPDYDPVSRPCRDRLIWEIQIHTGMRLKEAVGLTVHQIRDLGSSMPVGDDEMFAAKAMWLTVVKGGSSRARDAIVPNWLLREILLYTEGERSERGLAVQAFLARKKPAGRAALREPDALFLNHASAHRDPGAKLKRKNLQRTVAATVVAAGLVETVHVVDPATGQRLPRQRPLFSDHGLRHTAAVWRYMAERAGGNPAPWRPVMLMLGHRDEATTQRIYLKASNTFEAQVSDAALRFFRALRPAPIEDDGDESDI